ncbi:MAG: hypothetical protein ACSHXF_01710 [Aquaticitalea sp.]
MFEDELIIREPKISLLKRMVFSISCGLFIILILYFHRQKVSGVLAPIDMPRIYMYLGLLFLILLFTILPIIIRDYIYLDFKNLKIRYAYEIGLFSYKEKWQDLEDLEYISVFKKNELFEVNLWYKKNKIVNLFATDKFSDAIDNAYQIANKLQIDLLDASVKGNHRWVDKNVYAQTSRIEHL